MWEYSDKVIELYTNPKNVGSIEDATVVGEAGSLTCGDALKLYLKVDDNGVIQDAKFQTFGCGSAIASSSILTEMVKGMTIDEAAKISNKQIAEQLDGLPPEKMHCSVMGHEALEDAIVKYKGEPIEKTSFEDIICRCYDITRESLKHTIEENSLKNIEEVKNFCKATGACGHCKPEVQKVLDEVNEAIPKVKLTPTQLIIKVNKVIESFISDELNKDGGDIELVDIKDNKVYVKLQGSCKNCPSSNITLKNFVEKTLQEQVDESLEVVEYTK